MDDKKQLQSSDAELNPIISHFHSSENVWTYLYHFVIWLKKKIICLLDFLNINGLDIKYIVFLVMKNSEPMLPFFK